MMKNLPLVRVGSPEVDRLGLSTAWLWSIRWCGGKGSRLRETVAGEISGNRLVKWFNSMPGIRHNGGIDWDILILQLIYKKTLKDKTPGETCVSFSLPGTLVIDLCHMISLGQ